MAIISDMSQPLGNAIGNSLEVIEAIDTLKGKGPKDLTELMSCSWQSNGCCWRESRNIEEAREMLKAVIKDGTALELFGNLIEAQGGNSAIIHDTSLLPTAKYKLKFMPHVQVLLRDGSK